MHTCVESVNTFFIYDKIYIPDCIAHTIIMFHVYRVDDGRKCNMDIMYMDLYDEDCWVKFTIIH